MINKKIKKNCNKKRTKNKKKKDWYQLNAEEKSAMLHKKFLMRHSLFLRTMLP